MGTDCRDVRYIYIVLSEGFVDNSIGINVPPSLLSFAFLPRRQCLTDTNASPMTTTSGWTFALSTKRSRVKTTEPLLLFSMGTTPYCDLPSCTSLKTDEMVGTDTTSSFGKEFFAAFQICGSEKLLYTTLMVLSSKAKTSYSKCTYFVSEAGRWAKICHPVNHFGKTLIYKSNYWLRKAIFDRPLGKSGLKRLLYRLSIESVAISSDRNINGHS